MNYYALKTIVLGLILLFASSFITAQTDSISVHNEADFEPITLDGEMAFLNRLNNKIYSSLEYHSLKDSQAIAEVATTEETLLINNEIEFEEHWDTTRVNAYLGYKLEMPFALRFDDLECVSPIEDNVVVTSRFGKRRRGPHRGIDLDLVTGDNVRSILPGKVRFVGYSNGHGRTVVVRHENGVETVYAHLSTYHVKTNDIVSKGQILGQGGTSGNARGSHLHFEMRYKGVCIHPEFIIDFSDQPVIRANELWVTNSGINPLYHSSYIASNISVFESKEVALEGQQNEPKIHVVRKGDTLWAIARTNGMQVKDIVAMNKNVSSKSTLKIGQHLIISP